MRRGRKTTAEAAAMLAATAIITVAAVVAGAAMEKKQDEIPPEPTYAPEIIVIEPAPVPATMGPYSTTAFSLETDAPVWEPSTHENGYCEGYCWEGICPYFEGYPEPDYTERELEMLAKTVWGEARGCSPDEQRLVIWTVFQRVDADYWGDTIEAVLTAKYQFASYRESFPVDPDIYALVSEEAHKWWHGEEPPTHELYAPTAPYYYFDGDGRNNWFREEW